MTSQQPAARSDRASLVELGIVPDGTGNWLLRPLFDHTHSRGGHEALRRLLCDPLGDVASITRRQRLFDALAPVAPRIDWVQLADVAAKVARFLGSNYTVVPANPVARAAFALRHRDIVQFAEAGVRDVATLCGALRTVRHLLAELPADAELDPIREAIATALDHPGRVALEHTADTPGRSGAASFDGVAREVLAPAIKVAMAALDRLDALCALAIASHRPGHTTPAVCEDAPFELVGLSHPAVDDAVPNDVTLDGAARVLFLTGPNMAGKSTLLRAIGVAVHLAHLGLRVRATRAVLPLYSRILVSMGVQDDIARGESLYLAEVRRVRTIVRAVDRGERVFAIMDEVFRGTNVHDATEATSLLVSALANADAGTFVIASHLGDVGDGHLASPGVACACMETDMADGGYRFTYRLQRGVSHVHLGMLLLDAEGVAPILRRMATAAVPPRSAAAGAPAPTPPPR